MLGELTVQLTAFPERGWPRFAQASAAVGAAAPVLGQSAARALVLPTPLRLAVGVSFLSVLATTLGSTLRPGATVGGVVLHALAALVGYVGGATLAVELSPRWVATPARAQQGSDDASSSAGASAITRFASGAVLPVAVSGVCNLTPWLPVSFALALVGAAASVHSGWVGAFAMLALEGQPRKRAAAVPAGLAVSLVLLATVARTVLPT